MHPAPAMCEFSITLPSGFVPRGEKVILNMELRNVTAEPIYVNARFAVVPRIGDVRTTVRKGDLEVPFHIRVRMRALLASDFVLLKPSERVVAGYELTRGYRLEEPGTYDVSAEYVSEEVPKELRKENVLTGRLRSETVRLTLR